MMADNFMSIILNQSIVVTIIIFVVFNIFFAIAHHLLNNYFKENNLTEMDRIDGNFSERFNNTVKILFIKTRNNMGFILRAIIWCVRLSAIIFLSSLILLYTR